MINKEKLTDELTEMFIWYQWRLDNPMPSPNDNKEKVISHYMSDYMFRNKVKSLVFAVMQKVSENQINHSS